MELTNCSLCGTKLRLLQINLTEAIYTCPNIRCVYPFNDGNKPLEFVERDFVNINVQEERKQRNELDPDLKTPTYHVQNDDCAFLDDFLANCDTVEMTEDDIQMVDSEFEAFQQRVQT